MNERDDDSIELMIGLTGTPSPQESIAANSGKKQSLEARRKLEDYFEAKRLRAQIDDELSDLGC